jgi:plastocyanin
MGTAVYYFESKHINLADQNAYPTPTPSRIAREYTVFYQGGVFSPTNMHIHQGDSVKFQNNANTPIYIAHTRTSTDAIGLDSGGAITPNNSFTYTFNDEGVFSYYNNFNDTQRGSVIVRP